MRKIREAVMTAQLSPGKWQRLNSLTDDRGRFKMMAIDQRGSMVRAIARATGRREDQVDANDLSRAKAVITRILAPSATAVLTDPEYGYPQSLKELPPHVGLLLASEESGYDRGGPGGTQRKTLLLKDWSAAQAQQMGADAVKLLLYYHPDAAEEVTQHQQEVAQRVGEDCASMGMPFLLELVSYPLDDASSDSAPYARIKPDLVIRSAAEFAQPRYQVDILKLEFPADLKWTKDFSGGAFDGKERQPVYNLAEVQDYCHQLDQAAGMPWVILSAGVGIREFLFQVELAAEAGASGFLCGRAIWQDALTHYGDFGRMEDWLMRQGVYNFERANAFAGRAMPWLQHRRFAGASSAGSNLVQ